MCRSLYAERQLHTDNVNKNNKRHIEDPTSVRVHKTQILIHLHQHYSCSPSFVFHEDRNIGLLQFQCRHRVYQEVQAQTSPPLPDPATLIDLHRLPSLVLRYSF